MYPGPLYLPAKCRYLQGFIDGRCWIRTSGPLLVREAEGCFHVLMDVSKLLRNAQFSAVVFQYVCRCCTAVVSKVVSDCPCPNTVFSRLRLRAPHVAD